MMTLYLLVVTAFPAIPVKMVINCLCVIVLLSSWWIGRLPEVVAVTYKYSFLQQFCLQVMPNHVVPANYYLVIPLTVETQKQSSLVTMFVFYVVF